VSVYNTDELLTQQLAAACRGDESAAEAIYRRYSPAVFRLAASLLNDPDDADEVMQDTFVYALRNLGRYDASRSAFQTWLFTIAISRCRNKRRRRWLPTVSLDWLLGEESDAGGRASLRSVEDWLAVRGVRKELWDVVQALSPNLREALILRFVGGLAYAEIGQAVGCGAKAAESRVRTAVSALRARLTGTGVEPQEWLEALAEQ
jgi:RNA polymerase sigma-70 factor, ECF subfamily